MCCLLPFPLPVLVSSGGLAAAKGSVSILCHITTNLGQQSLRRTWLPKAVVKQVRALEVVIDKKAKSSWEHKGKLGRCGVIVGFVPLLLSTFQIK